MNVERYYLLPNGIFLTPFDCLHFLLHPYRRIGFLGAPQNFGPHVKDRTLNFSYEPPPKLLNNFNEILQKYSNYQPLSPPQVLYCYNP